MAEDLRKRTIEEEAEGPDSSPEQRSQEPIASLDADQAKEGGADYWDLDDDGDWGSSRQSAVSKYRQVFRRSTMEIGVAFVCHLVLMCFYIYVHVKDATVFKKSKGVGFEGSFTFGGRWKYLTYLNLWVQFLYFFLCFFVDIMPYGATKVQLRKLCDLVFTTLALPLTIFVTVMFWSLYAIDRELIYPKSRDETIPFIMNHYWHTTTLVCITIELILVFHKFPSNWTAMVMTVSFSIIYIVWVVWAFSMNKKWPYPFLAAIPLPLLPVFFVGSCFTGLIFYFLGKWLCYLRWRERHQVLAEIECKNN